MNYDVTMVLLFLAIAAGMVFGALYLGKFLRPVGGRKEAETTYECGEPPISTGWYNFNPRFYMIALMFLIFDVEIVITFPVLLVLRDWAAMGMGWIAFIEILIFIVILVAGLAYLWAKGDLEWIKRIEGQTKEGVR